MTRHHRTRHGPSRRQRHHCVPGVIHRVTSGIADRFGIHRHWVLAAFIFAVIVNFPLAVIAFLLALYWINHPGKLERVFDRTSEQLRRAFASDHQPAYAGAGPADTSRDDMPFEPDREFADLRAKFDELERRAGKMEEQVAGEEYELRREFERMKGSD